MRVRYGIVGIVLALWGCQSNGDISGTEDIQNNHAAGSPDAGRSDSGLAAGGSGGASGGAMAIDANGGGGNVVPADASLDVARLDSAAQDAEVDRTGEATASDDCKAYCTCAMTNCPTHLPKTQSCFQFCATFNSKQLECRRGHCKLIHDTATEMEHCQHTVECTL